MECAVLIGLGLRCMNQSLSGKGDGITMMELKWSGLNLRLRSEVSFSSNHTAATQEAGDGRDVKSAAVSTTQASFHCGFFLSLLLLIWWLAMVWHSEWGPAYWITNLPPWQMTQMLSGRARTQTPWATAALQSRKGKSQRLIKHPQGTTDLDGEHWTKIIRTRGN